MSRHVVPIIGHTLNTDNWRAEAEFAYGDPEHNIYQPTSKWVDHLLIHDDNFGMYLCLPVDTLRRITLPKYDRVFRAFSAFAIVPPKVNISALEAEQACVYIAYDVLSNLSSSASTSLNPWLQKLSVRKPPWAIRTLLTTKDKYKTHLENETDFEGNTYTVQEAEEITCHLPDYFWLSEVTLPDLYHTNKSKILDFFYHCEDKSGGKMLTPTDKVNLHKIQINMPEGCLKWGGNKPVPTTVKSHFPLIKHNQGSGIPEW